VLPHTVAQLPQLFGSVCQLVQKALLPAPQTLKPAVHAVVQLPDAHVWLGEHALAQLPQLFGSICVLVQAPPQALGRLPPQEICATTMLPAGRPRRTRLTISRWNGVSGAMHAPCNETLSAGHSCSVCGAAGDPDGSVPRAASAALAGWEQHSANTIANSRAVRLHPNP